MADRQVDVAHNGQHLRQEGREDRKHHEDVGEPHRRRRKGLDPQHRSQRVRPDHEVELGQQHGEQEMRLDRDGDAGADAGQRRQPPGHGRGLGARRHHRKGRQEADQRDMLALGEVVHRQDQEDGGRHREQRPAGDAAQDADAVESAPGQP